MQTTSKRMKSSMKSKKFFNLLALAIMVLGMSFSVFFDPENGLKIMFGALLILSLNHPPKNGNSQSV